MSVLFPASAPKAEPRPEIPCPRCKKTIDVEPIGTNAVSRCPLCQGEFESIRFQPRIAHAKVTELATAGPEGGQPCAIHQRNAAVAACERCGSFVCSLCRIDFDEHVYCPSCFERLSEAGSIESAKTRFRDYEGLTSLTATLGCLITWLGIVLGPLALYYGVKGLRQKKEMGETDGRVGIVIAMTLAVIELLVSGALIAFFVFGLMQS
jgi:hypothetical protein